MHSNSRKAMAFGFALSSLCVLLAGCGVGGTISTPTAPAGTPGAPLKGSLYGGQQPIVGANVYLYAAGNTGYGSAYPYTTGNSLLGNTSVVTDGGGFFNITGDYTCPASNPEVYIEANGGVPVAGGAANGNIIMLAALGPCASLHTFNFIAMNELTTVASVWALAPFMTGPTNVGTTGGTLGNNVGLINAFATVNTLVNVQTGVINTILPAGATIPTNKLNSLADIIASCVNTAGGVGANGGVNSCVTLFNNATPPGGSTPTNTLAAALNIAQNPGQHVSALASLADRTSPFEPIQAPVPTDWTLSVRYTAASHLTAGSVPNGIAADQTGNIWITNNGTINAAGTAYTTRPSLVEISPTGTFMQTQSEAAYLGVAIDLSGNAWSSFTYLDKTTSGSPGINTAYTYTASTDGGLTSGTIPSIAVDGSGNVWATSQTTATNTTPSVSSLSEFTNAGVAKSPANGFTGGGISSAVGVAITPH